MTQLDLGIRVPCERCGREHTARRDGAVTFIFCRDGVPEIVAVHPTKYDAATPQFTPAQSRAYEAERREVFGR
jgi:hypothetical protein